MAAIAVVWDETEVFDRLSSLGYALEDVTRKTPYQEGLARIILNNGVVLWFPLEDLLKDDRSG